MNDLEQHLLRSIRTTGPLSIARYMGECLFHPRLGYYTSREVFGQAGDFTTAPEISQMFGELLGLSLAGSWIDQGRPPRFALVELGPGRGTLMADVLRAGKSVPGFIEAAEIHLVEASPRLRAVQRDTLGDMPVTWHQDVTGLPEHPLFLLANEFFDALPIRQFVRDGGGWRERMIADRDGRIGFSLSERVPVAALADRLGDTSEGDLVELCPALPGIVGEIARRVADTGGCALIVDYGGWRSLGDTLQAVRNHAYVDPLRDPGMADLTAHVDFEAIARAATSEGAAATDMLEQGALLERLGITERARALASRRTGQDEIDTLVAAHRRLTHPQEMGSLFKAIAIHPDQASIPPGFVS